MTLVFLFIDYFPLRFIYLINEGPSVNHKNEYFFVYTLNNVSEFSEVVVSEAEKYDRDRCFQLRKVWDFLK